MKTVIFFMMIVSPALNKCYCQQPQQTGKIIFDHKCAKCHGRNGTKGLFGATNLQQSALSDDQYFSTIFNGRKAMPSWKKKLSGAEISQVIGYIKQLRK